MPEPIAIRVLTNQGLAVSGEAVSIVAPGSLGYLGILRNHAPLVTATQPGTLSWRTPAGESKAVSIGDGLLEISHSTLTILTDVVTPPPGGAHA